MNEKNTERRNLYIKIAAAVICIAFLTGLVVYQYIFRTFNTYRIVREQEVVLEEGYRTMGMKDHLLLYNKDGMRCINTKGKAVWDITYQLQKPCVVVDGGMAAVCGYGDHLIYMMDETGCIAEINTNLPIRNLCVAEGGYVGAVLDDNDVYWVYIYDSKGNEMTRARTTMEQSGYPLSLSLSPNGKLLGISYLYLDAGVVQNNVAFYNLGEVGQNYTDQYMSGFIYEEIVPEIHYMNNQTAAAVSGERFMIYSGGEKPGVLKEILINDTLQAVYWGDENVILIYDGRGDQGRYLMKVYDLAGNVVLEKGFGLEYTDIKSKDGIITIYNSSELLVLTLDGQTRYTGGLGGNIRVVEPTSSKYRYMVLFDEMFKIIELE